jgi:transposase
MRQVAGRVKRRREENDRLKAQIRYQQRKIDEGYFGSSTPSAQKPFKANTKAERNNGGGRGGHRGYGRTTSDEREADEVIVVDTEPMCPDCHVALESLDLPDRTVIEVEPVQIKKVLFKLTKRRCPQCRRVFRAKAPGVLPKCKQGNSLLAHVATEHYLHQVTLGSLSERLGIGESSLIEGMHHLARLFKEVSRRAGLIAEYRQAPVKHADETSWPNDGRNGYAWLFCTPTSSIFRLRLTRAASVAKEVLGTEPLAGTLVVDRYNAYNKILCAIQYCYSHLLREVQDAGKEFPDSQEVQDFVGTTAPLLSQAMKLRTLPISDKVF